MIRREDDPLRHTGTFKRVEKLDNSPDVDRDLVQWKNYAYENGNYLQTPGTYATSVVRDCMFGKFLQETNKRFEAVLDGNISEFSKRK
mgnify:CR=1 FL=1